MSNAALAHMPAKTGRIKRVHIKDKLRDLNLSFEDLNLGNFDHIGEFTAKKSRPPDHPLYKKVGAFFRPNYERGILIYQLIKHYEVESFLEIGFGRGYGAVCAAMAMAHKGSGKVVTIEPNLNEDFLKYLNEVFPPEWLNRIEFKQGTSQEVLPTLEEDFDFIYIDGDHTYEGVKFDWEHTKDKYNTLLLFDDYHMPTKNDNNAIQCAHLIDQIDDKSKELIIMDRRLFLDDRGYSDEEIDYGQVLLTRDL